jgi:hypothetical protein
VDSQPELPAHHCTEAGLTDKAAGLRGKAGQRSLARSALVEATARLSRALDQLGFSPATADLRREQVKLQVALANALMHVKGFAADETNASPDQARLFIERAERLAEPPQDPLVLFSVLYGLWVAKLVAFNGGAVRELGPNSWGSRSKGDRPDHDRVPPHGQVPTGHGGASLKAARTVIKGWRFTILPSIVCWRRVLAKIREWQSCPSDRWLYGCLVIPRPRSQIQIALSRMRARSAKPLR